MRQRALLAVFLLNPNRILPVDRLIADVWGDEPPETAEKMVRNNVSQLRNLLQLDVVTHPGGYELRLDPEQLDSVRFERLLQEGRQALEAGDPAGAAATLEEGLGLWRGPAFADFPYDLFAATEIGRLEELRVSAVEDRVEADLALGRHADLVGELEALVAQHPLRERLRAHLMLALYRSGRQAEALEAYQRTRDFLVEELGLEPSRALQQLERSILRQDPSLEPERSPPPAAEPVAVPPREVRKTVSIVVAEIVVLGPRRDPEAVRAPMSRAFETASRVLERHGGSVEKLLTGAVMGVFGIPAVHEDDPLRAVRAATELRDEIAALNDELESDWSIRLAVRTAVNTGEVVAGGEEVLAGDAAERAARLQQAAVPDEILIADATKQLVDVSVHVEPVAPLTFDRSTERRRPWRLLEILPGAAPFVRRVDAPMVGREQELAQLGQAFERVVRERSVCLFTVLGPAGIGKSRLATEFASSVADSATVVTGRCPPYGEAITFWPLGEIVRQLAGDDEERAIAELDVPSEEVFSAARKLFEAHARERPLVVVFEDLHWAEPTLLDLVEHVAESARDAPLLILCLARPELLEERSSWGGGKLNATTLLLGPLSESESAQLIESLLGARGLRPETIAGIKEAAEGNPLFLQHLLAILSEDAPDGDVAIPPTIHAVLTARLDRLQSEERAVLERASVIGREFSRAALSELAPVEARGSIDEQLGALVRRDLIAPHRSLFPGDEAFRFRHVLLREAAYESVPKQARAGMHEQFATWLEQAAGARARELEESVGHHLEQAYRYRVELAPVDERARALARRAAERLAAPGRRAHAGGDLPAAVALLSRAAGLLEGDADLLVDLGEALRERGDLGRAESVLADAAAAATDPALESHVAVARLRLQLQTDPDVKTDEVLRGAQDAVAVFERLGDERRLAKAWELLAWVPWFGCQAAAAEAALLRALEHARRAGDRRTEAQSLNLLIGAVWLGPTPVADAVARCQDILAQPDEQRRIRASALRALAGLKAMQGSFDEARRAAEDCRAILDDLGLRITAASAAETYAIVELLAGDPAAAERELRRGYERLGEMGAASEVAPVLAALLAHALHAQGRYEEALRFSERSEEAAAPDDLSAQVQWRAARAKVLARTGNREQGEPLAHEAVRLAAQTDFLVLHGDALVDLAEILDPAERAPVLAEALRLYEAKGNVVAAERARS